MSQAVEVVLIQAGVFILWAWGLLGQAGCSWEGGHHVQLTLTISLSQSKTCLYLVSQHLPVHWPQLIRPHLLLSLQSDSSLSGPV